MNKANEFLRELETFQRQDSCLPPFWNRILIFEPIKLWLTLSLTNQSALHIIDIFGKLDRRHHWLLSESHKRWDFTWLPLRFSLLWPQPATSHSSHTPCSGQLLFLQIFWVGKYSCFDSSNVNIWVQGGTDLPASEQREIWKCGNFFSKLCSMITKMRHISPSERRLDSRWDNWLSLKLEGVSWQGLSNYYYNNNYINFS